MSKIVVKINNDILEIRKERKREDEVQQVDLSMDFKKIISRININSGEYVNKILLIEKYQDIYIGVYTTVTKVIVVKCDTLEKFYKILLKVRQRVISVNKIFGRIHINYVAFMENKYEIDYKNVTFNIGDNLHKEIDLKVFNFKTNIIKKVLKCFKHISFKVSDIKDTEMEINNVLEIRIQLKDTLIAYSLLKPARFKNERYYFSPFLAFFSGVWAIHFRRRKKGAITMVKRPIEEPERTLKFKLLENRLSAFLLYYFGKLNKKIRRKPINLYYEKFAEKAEEGTYQLFEKALESKESSNYFVIDKKSEDYKKLEGKKNIIKKYSFRFYVLFYSCTSFISTEAPSHTNILRSNSKYYRRNICDNNFIFLQHGVTYLKSQTNNSIFMKGKDGEPTFIVVGSEKEKEAVIEMQGLKEEEILITGLPIFDLVKYNHINNISKDMVVIMLTWKPYEEYLENYEDTSYYKNIIEVFNMLSKYIRSEDIYIVPHPKVKEKLLGTSMKDSLYEGKISEILQKSKLVVTDYSSICYNSFYQGAGVLFYQPDLEEFESDNGELVPKEHEYIGYRALNFEELENHIKQGIRNGRVDLDYYRKKKFIDNYNTINEFHDGKNIERIYKELKKRNII